MARGTRGATRDERWIFNQKARYTYAATCEFATGRGGLEKSNVARPATSSVRWTRGSMRWTRHASRDAMEALPCS